VNNEKREDLLSDQAIGSRGRKMAEGGGRKAEGGRRLGVAI